MNKKGFDGVSLKHLMLILIIALIISLLLETVGLTGTGVLHYLGLLS
jgi:hypothetical protein